MDKRKIFAAISASAVLIASCGIANVSAEDAAANEITLTAAPEKDVIVGVCGKTSHGNLTKTREQ